MASEQPVRRVAPTLEAVAEAAGVSRSTVSRVVNGSSQVRPEVVTAVNAAIERLNYIPNRLARSLANRHTMAIAVVVPEDTTRFFGDPFFAAVIEGISDAIEPSDYVLSVTVASHSAPAEKTRRFLLGGNVDGVIVVSHHSGDEFLTSLDATMPVVFGGRPFLPEQHSGTNYVDVDNAAGAAMGTQYLINQGRTRIGTIAGPDDMQVAIDRAAGWQHALEDAGQATDLIVRGDFSRASGASAMRRLLELDATIDGVFAASDLMAAGAIAVLRERGIRVPADVAVVGFDDIPPATLGDVQLTTVHQPSREMGHEMGTLLLALLRGEGGGAGGRQRTMPTWMVVRESA